MTRLNSTFRSGCKLDNRTIREEKQAGQAYHLRKHSHSRFKQNQVFLELHKTLIRTGSLFGTRLHERPRRTDTTCEITLRAMDVARQSSMEEGLQVKLLSWKEKPDNLIAGKIAEHTSYDNEGILSIGPDEKLRNGNSKLSHGQCLRYKQSKECSEKVNGEDKIESGVKTDNRTGSDSKTVEEILQQSNILLGQSTKDFAVVSNGNFNETMHLRDIKNGEWNGKIKNSKDRSRSSAVSKPYGHESRSSSLVITAKRKISERRPNSLVLPSNETLNELNSTFENMKGNGRISEPVKKEEDNFMELNTSDSNGDCYYGRGATVTDLTNNFDTNICESRIHSTFPNDQTEDFACKEETDISNNLAGAEGHSKVSCTCIGHKDVDSKPPEAPLEMRPKRSNRSLKLAHNEDYVIEVHQLKRKKKEKSNANNKESKKMKKGNTTKRKRIQKDKSTCSKKEDEDGKLDNDVLDGACDGESDGEKYVNVECVLGIRHNDSDKPQVLVQFMDSTSNWIKTSEMLSPMSSLSDYFTFPNQELAVIHRLPFAWFGEPNASWSERKLEITDFGEFDLHQKAAIDTVNRHRSLSSKEYDKSANHSISLLSQCDQIDLMRSDEQCDEYFHRDDNLLDLDLEEEIDEKLPLPSNNLKSELLPTNKYGYTVMENVEDGIIFGHEDNTTNNLSECKGVERNDNELNDTLERTSKLTDIELTSDTVPTYVSRNGELQVLESDHVEIILKHKDKRSKRIRSETCDNLIQQLELRITDDKCRFIVISGLEDYFASSMDMEKLIKFPAESEKTKYDEKMANLRYLFQTLKNYPKPIVAIISSAATGLAAALLSLVDMVYDQSSDGIKENGCRSKPHLPVLAPKLMGLHHKNEALLMGELPDPQLEDQLKQVNNIFRSFKFSNEITSTLKEMRVNEKLSYERPSPKKFGRLASSSKASTTKPFDVCHKQYIKTRLAHLWHPGAVEQSEEETGIDKELKEEIEKEQELAAQCLKELTEFWNELADSAR